MTRKIKQKYKWSKEIIPIVFKSFILGKNNIRILNKNITTKNNKDIYLFITINEETEITDITNFLNYYRKLGVKHFFILDLTQKYDLQNFKKIKDISTFILINKFNENDECFYVNYLLYKYGSGNWCIVCKLNEYLIFPHMDNRSLSELTSYLELCRVYSLFTVIVNMFTTKYGESFFDSKYYLKEFKRDYRYYKITKSDILINDGIVEERQRISLIKWNYHYAYINGTKLVLPRKLNDSVGKTKTMGALLKYNESNPQTDPLIKNNHLIKYTSWIALYENGLINVGEFY